MIFVSEEYIGIKFQGIQLGSLDNYDIDIDPYIETLKSLIGKIPSESIKDGSGNVSMRIDHDSFIITTTGMDLSKVYQKNQFSVVTKIKNPNIYFYGKSFPSSESPMHGLIYKHYEDIQLIIHTHPPNLEKLILSNHFNIAEHNYPYGTWELGKIVVNLMKNNYKVIIKNHGIVVGGKYPEDVLNIWCNFI